MATKTLIVIHCADTKATQDIGVDEIRWWHIKERGWKDIGYAYVIRRDGKLELGRDLDKDGDVVEETGAHAADFNATGIGICLVGGKGSKGQAENNFTQAQFKMLRWLCLELTSRYPNIKQIKGHYQLPKVAKACPSFDVTNWCRDNDLGEYV